jgi:hypothetical protein
LVMVPILLIARWIIENSSVRAVLVDDIFVVLRFPRRESIRKKRYVTVRGVRIRQLCSYWSSIRRNDIANVSYVRGGR